MHKLNSQWESDIFWKERKEIFKADRSVVKDMDVEGRKKVLNNDKTSYTFSVMAIRLHPSF